MRWFFNKYVTFPLCYDRFQNATKYERKVYTLPKRLDEKVAWLHLDHLGVKLTKLRPDQAKYIGIDPEGPFKPEQYRY